MKEEPSLGNTVCFIIEFIGHHFIEILQLLFLQDFRMKPCNAVD